MLNKDLPLPADLREALFAGARRMLFPETGEADCPPGGDSALKQLEDAGLAQVRELAEELAGLLEPRSTGKLETEEY
jgi:hypothetical protein